MKVVSSTISAGKIQVREIQDQYKNLLYICIIATNDPKLKI